ncbi:MAG: elongation factor P hydroxylase [Myxococcota bacterium]
MEFEAQKLERLFAECFAETYQTALVGGGAEPLYVPSPDPDHKPHEIIYREDFFASALHEVAHWCLAGASRRTQEDYGYWYSPDGRNAEQQVAFEAAESKPQAIESIFSTACAFSFQLSADNLDAGFGPSERFAEAVERERTRYESDGLPRRAERFRQALLAEFESR